MSAINLNCCLKLRPVFSAGIRDKSKDQHVLKLRYEFANHVYQFFTMSEILLEFVKENLVITCSEVKHSEVKDKAPRNTQNLAIFDKATHFWKKISI